MLGIFFGEHPSNMLGHVVYSLWPGNWIQMYSVQRLAMEETLQYMLAALA